jgi:hypothetical protein
MNSLEDRRAPGPARSLPGCRKRLGEAAPVVPVRGSRTGDMARRFATKDMASLCVLRRGEPGLVLGVLPRFGSSVRASKTEGYPSQKGITWSLLNTTDPPPPPQQQQQQQQPQQPQQPQQ